MKYLMIAVALAGSALPVAASFLPKQQVQRCSAAEWIWDSLVQDIGCSFTD